MNSPEYESEKERAGQSELSTGSGQSALDYIKQVEITLKQASELVQPESPKLNLRKPSRSGKASDNEDTAQAELCEKNIIKTNDERKCEYIDEADLESGIKNDQNPGLPRLWFGGLGCMALSWTLYKILGSFTSPYIPYEFRVFGFENQYWTLFTIPLLAFLPLNFYWTHCIKRMLSCTASLYKTSQPLSSPFAILLSLLGLILAPWNWGWQAVYTANSPYLDSFFSSVVVKPNPFEPIPLTSWGLLMFLWPLLLYRHIKKAQKKPLTSGDWFAAAGLGIVSSYFSLYTSGAGEEARVSGWILSQTICISLLAMCIKKPKTEAARQSAAGDLERSLRGMPAGADIVLQYHPFAAISRWRKQQEGSLSKELKSILLVAVPLLLLSFGGAFYAIKELENGPSQQAKPVVEKLNTDSSLQQSIDSSQYRTAIINHLNPLTTDSAQNTSCTIVIDSKGSIISTEDRGYANNSVEEQLPSLSDRLRQLEPFPRPPAEALWNGRLAIRITEIRGYSSPWFSIEFAKDPKSFSGAPPSDYKQFLSNTRRAQGVRDEVFEGSLNTSFLSITAFVLLAIMGVAGSYIYRQPTHIGLSRRGLRFLYRRTFNMSDGIYLPWSDLSKITMERPEKSTSPLDEKLCFKSGDSLAKIKMGSLTSIEDRELLLKAIEKWAPNVPREATVTQALQAPADHSYTELWLQALSAAPKRERLKPLDSGLQLKNGSYKILEQIGTGGQGNAYLASGIDGNRVVLKECILPVFVDVNVRRSALEQFENEARLLRQMDHPQVVKLLDFFVEDHRTYLVLEHINGKSLRQAVKENGAMPEKTVRELAAQMCRILSYLHNLTPPVIHRDFTPDNLILRKDGTLKLIDFNVAKQVVESTTSGTVVGKHAYLPPEQFRGMPECASDIYAMGATLYYLLCGKDPEPISTSHPSKLVTGLSEEINKLIENSTALDTALRYKSIEELHHDLDKINESGRD